MHPTSICPTVFSKWKSTKIQENTPDSPRGQWVDIMKLTRLGMGLKNSSACLMRALELLMRGLTYKVVFCYIDDFLILIKTFEEHMSHLPEVFSRSSNRESCVESIKMTSSEEIDTLSRFHHRTRHHENRSRTPTRRHRFSSANEFQRTSTISRNDVMVQIFYSRLFGNL